MTQSHSYAQIPVSEDLDDHDHPTQNAPQPMSLLSQVYRSTVPNGYSPLQHHPDEAGENDTIVMLQPLSTPTEGSAGEASQAGAGAAASSSSSSSSSSSTSPLQHQRPRFPAAAGAKRIIQSTMDGVFSNLSAKPTVEKPAQEELPPPYKSVAMDAAPIYTETENTNTGNMGDEFLIDNIPVGSLTGFLWAMAISMSFQYVGFFLTYLLHTSHSTKNGSKMGLGITFLSTGVQLLSGNSMDPSDDDEDVDQNIEYMGSAGQSVNRISTEILWLACIMFILGGALMIHSALAFILAKRSEMVFRMNSSSPSTDSSTAPATSTNNSIA